MSSSTDPAGRVKQLIGFASNVEINPSVSAKKYLRSGEEMLKMAGMYMDDGAIESAFILYYKFSVLFIERLPAHPEYKSIPAGDRSRNKQRITKVMEVAEKLKKILITKYEKEEAERKERESRIAEQKAREEAEAAAVAAAGKTASESIESGSVVDEQREQLRQLQHEEKRRLDGQLEPSAPPSSDDVLPPSYSQALIDSDSDGRSSVPSVDRSTKPSTHLTWAGEHNSNNKHGLKDIILPGDLPGRFLQLAEQNTRRNVETCGILAGKLSSSRFTVTHVIIPKQTGTPDSCTTSNEEQVFEVQDKHNLITLGWIHTHPSQTAFLSSVDLHTHCSYQLMLPEAVAVVVAPKHKQTGVFYLTPEYGLQFVTNCTKSGFHPHPTSPVLFEECSHAKTDANLKVLVEDLR